MSNIYLVGFMAAGKSSVGRGLARRLGRPFVDLDRQIEKTAGMSISRIFEAEGEAGFRTREHDALMNVSETGSAVVATGGGAICPAANREIMHRDGGCTVFLDVPWAVLAERLAGDNEHRPLFTTEDEARRLYESRRPHYAAARLTVVLDGGEDEEHAVDRVLEILSGVTCGT